MTNFTFLQLEWPSLYSKMKSAEQRVRTEPISAASYCRLVLEECVHKLYALEYIEMPYNTDLIK